MPKKNKIKFEQLSIEQGLSPSTVFYIVQDRRGFMWFGTEEGFNKYDGYIFTIYKHNQDKFNSLSNNVENTIYEDKSGTLWIGIRGVGLNKFD